MENQKFQKNDQKRNFDISKGLVFYVPFFGRKRLCRSSIVSFLGS